MGRSTTKRSNQRLQALPAYVFAEIQQLRRAAEAAGRDVIDLGVGDPDLPTPKPIVERAKRALDDPANHRYPFGFGLLEFRQAAARYLARRFAVQVDPLSQILPLFGAKDAIAHLPLALLDPGQALLFTEPGYPAYRSSALLSGTEPVGLPLREEHGFLPRFDEIEPRVVDRAGLLHLNYPNNPTGVAAPDGFLREAVAWTARHGLVLSHDAPYLEVSYTGQPATSVLALAPDADHVIELHSLSKTFCMCGWRLGFAAGSASVIAALAQAKSNIDTGVFLVAQHAGAEALDRAEELVPPLLEIYRRRRDLLVAGLRAAGWKVNAPDGTFYVWCRVPTPESSLDFCHRMLAEHAVVATPGSGLAPAGEGYVRLAFTASEQRIAQACERLGRSA